jgi:hypothetical protein
MSPVPQVQEWVTYIFNHPVAGDIREAWYWAEHAPEWPGPREDIPALVAETFEHGGELLARFSEDATIPAAARLRALRSFVPLFEQVMATRCSAHLCHRRCPQTADIVDEFLSSARGLRPELIAYAELARIGAVV